MEEKLWDWAIKRRMEALLPEGRGRRSKLVAEMQHNRGQKGRMMGRLQSQKRQKTEKAVGLNTPFAYFAIARPK